MYKMTPQRDEDLVAAIRAGGAARDEALREIYLRPGLREAVQRHVLNNGGSSDDALDVFQETLVLFDRNVRAGKFEGRSAAATYFVAIAKWHWLGLRRQRGRYSAELPDAGGDALVDSPETDAIRAEERALLDAAINQIGGRCQELLRLYQLDLPMQEIAQLMNYENADVAKKEAYRCRMRLRDTIMGQRGRA